jgi:acyl-coenzyme A thioesterase PaaI-like protein
MDNQHPLERFFSAQHPLSSYLSFRLLGNESHVLTAELVASEAFVTDPESGKMHSGFASLVMDTVFGGTVMGEMERMQPIATIGLTTQHLRRARLGETLICEARFEGIHEGVAHVSGRLTVAGEILSTATGTFMIGTRSKPLGVRV